MSDLIFKKIGEKTLYQGWRAVIERSYHLPNGMTKHFDIISYRDAAFILALTKEKNVILAKQYRPGPEKIITELPAGLIEEGEEPLVTAGRELLEETGYEGNIEFVCRNYTGAYNIQMRHNFVATDCVKIQEQKLDRDEFIEIVEMTLDDFRKHLRTGQLTNVESAYLGLDHLGLL